MRWTDRNGFHIRCRGRDLAVLLVAAAMWSPAVAAQAVYRCVEKGKPVSYQTDPCPRQATISAIREYVPERNPTENELAWRRHRTEREMAARNRAAAQPAQHVTVVQNRTEGPTCAQARAERDAWERRVGLGRTIDGLRWWQDYVQRACR